MAGRPRGSAGRRNSPPAPCALLTSSWRCDALRTATSSGRLRTPTPPTGRSRSGGTRQLYPAIARSLGPRCFHANLDSRRAPPPASSSPPPRPHATLTLTPPRRRPSATSSSSSRRAPSLARARAPRRMLLAASRRPGHPRAPRCPACQLHRLVRAPSSTPSRLRVPPPRALAATVGAAHAEPRQAVPDGAPPDRPRPLLSRVAGSCTPLAPPPHRSRSRSLSR